METYHGHVRTPADAIILFEACRVGLLPRVQRRLSEKERLSIKSGSVFVWDEREAGMRRWTDGKSWSASRVSGSFLTYREMEGKRGGNGFAAPRSNRDGLKGSEHESADDGPDGYRYKPDGLMKQSFSITTSTGQHLHLISYFARSSAVSQNLQQPSNDSQLRHIRPEKGMYPESTVHEQNTIPAVTRGPMTSPAFAPSPHQPANMGNGLSYARPPPHPSHYPMGYAPGWAPPSPMHTPPPYSPYYHNSHQQHPQSIGHSPHPSIGHSPLQHMHHAYPPPSHAYAPVLTPFDRAPAPLTNSNTLPPPPPPPSSTSHQHMPPMHNGPMPPMHNGHSSHHSSHSHSHSHTLPEVSPRPDVRHEQPSHAPSRSANMVIDPSLTASTNNDAKRYESHSSSHASAGAQRTDDHKGHSAQPPPSSATTIPSISALINETSGPAPPVRSSSRSPNGPQQRHTQDIPPYKMGYDPARDVQALRHLDKATLRF
ncbi:hypothetical protein AAFC00_001264 [Neodothiora populina]|uniref:cAMP-independent regulatory protein pac2 n=1 Tax=Neodothiora populina TaxID=2781224 RepID=A0ABR3PNG9_9PEZI